WKRQGRRRELSIVHRRAISRAKHVLVRREERIGQLVVLDGALEEHGRQVLRHHVISELEVIADRAEPRAGDETAERLRISHRTPMRVTGPEYRRDLATLEDTMIDDDAVPSRHHIAMVRDRIGIADE